MAARAPRAPRGAVWFDLFRRDVEDIVRGVEGEQFVTRLGNPAQFVVLELCRSRPLVSAVGQVAGAVVAVAAFDGGLIITRPRLCFCLCRPLSGR